MGEPLLRDKFSEKGTLFGAIGNHRVTGAFSAPRTELTGGEVSQYRKANPEMKFTGERTIGA
jgi:hypothetical protein